MSLLSVQQKLELEQQLKLQQQENRMQMKHRENLVYGLKAADDISSVNDQAVGDTGIQGSKKGFIFRSIIAVMLFVLVCLMKYNHVEIAGIKYQTVIESLGNTDFINGIDFTNYITYTDI